MSFVVEYTIGHGNRDVTVTFQVTREFYVDTFIIFGSLSLEYGEIDTRIESVSFVTLHLENAKCSSSSSSSSSSIENL